MIELKQIEALQNMFQTSKENVVREYAQHLWLSEFYRHKLADEVLFKGGTALRLVYKSPRFSEDLDFSYFGRNIVQVEEVVLSVWEQLEQWNIETELEESKETTGGYLANIKVKLFGVEVMIVLEMSSRKKNGVRSEVLPVASEYIPTYTAKLLPKEVMFAEKMDAALSRSKPRDFFDVYWLLREGLMPMEQRERLGDLEKVLNKRRVKFGDELSLFLPRSLRQMVKDFPVPLLREIERWG